MPEWLSQALDKVSFAPIFSTGSGRPINALDSTDALRTGAYPFRRALSGCRAIPFFSPKSPLLTCG